jgi:hypothetical protein
MITRADIRKEWPWIRPLLERFSGRFTTDWKPEDVYADCVHGKAFLYTAIEDRGFMVVKEFENRFTGEPLLHVWILCMEEDTPHGAIAKYMPALHDLARQYGYKKVTMESPRRAWAKHPQWREGMTTYTYEVE